MNTLTTKQKTRRENLKMTLFICVASLLLTSVIVYVFPVAFADNAAMTGIMKLLINVLCIICGVVGVIFAIVGLVKFAIAHANEDGPAQSKAALMIGTGIVLTILAITLKLNINTIIGWLPDGGAIDLSK